MSLKSDQLPTTVYNEKEKTLISSHRKTKTLMGRKNKIQKNTDMISLRQDILP